MVQYNQEQRHPMVAQLHLKKIVNRIGVLLSSFIDINHIWKLAPALQHSAGGERSEI